MSHEKFSAYNPTELISALARKHVELGVNDGLFCTDVVEDVPKRERGGCEKVIKGKNNAFIILGRDRPASIASGGSGNGQTACGMIDMVVGLNASVSAKKVKKKEKPKGPESLTSCNFATDAARIYMSQRCLGKGGIDGYLGMTRNTSPSAENKAAIAIKSDHVRIVGRECVRIYAAKTQNFQGLGMGGEKTALGSRITKGRIDLCAGRESDLQPAVLGENLKEFLLQQMKTTDADVLRIIMNILEQLIEITGVVVNFGPPLAKNFLTNIINTFDVMITNLNSRINAINGLDDLTISGGRSIVSNTVFIT